MVDQVEKVNEKNGEILDEDKDFDWFTRNFGKSDETAFGSIKVTPSYYAKECLLGLRTSVLEHQFWNMCVSKT